MKNNNKLSKVAENVLAMVEDGLKNDELPMWTQSWNGAGSNIPINYATKKAYNGLNCYLTWVAMENEYKHNYWLTYNQIIQMMKLKKTKKGLVTEDGKVFKGKILKSLSDGKQKASAVEFWTIKYKLKDKWKTFTKAQYEKAIKNGTHTEEDFYKYWGIGGIYNVFNIEQTNLPLPKPKKRKKYKVTDSEKLFDEIMEGFEGSPELEKIKMPYGSSPHYIPSKHKIVMPLMTQYQSKNRDKGHLSWFKTASHEAVHSSGHESVLGRDGIINVGEWEGHKERYATEELIAEMGASMIMDWYGFNYKETIQNTQAYIKGWLGRIKEDPNTLIDAMRHSNRAVGRILNIK
tara:strand:- start:3677 stop:4717 length:1041 start_codon:yes stop_codon:yes gene_type:complete